MAIQYDSFGTPYDDTEYELDMYGSAVPIGDGVSSTGIYPTSTSTTETPPAGAVGKDSTGTNWIDSLGRVLGPVLTSIGTPWLNNLQSGGLLNAGTDMLRSAGGALAGVTAPDLTRLIPQLQLQVMQGQMTPAQAAATLQQASEMQGVQTDVGSLQGQRRALQQLDTIASQGGMSDADRAALQQAMNQAAAKTASDRAAQVQQLQMQGNAGTGAELAARLSGIQSGANTNALAGAQTAQAAQQRALSAIQSGLAGNAALNTQQFEQAAQKARAQDAINQFNAQAQNTMAESNAARSQASNLANFNMANTIAGTNVGIQNKAAMMPYEAAQKNYENQLGLGKARSAVQVAAGTPLINAATQQIARSSGAGAAAAAGGGATGGTGGTGGNLGSTIGGLAGNYFGGPVGGAIGSAIGSGLNDVVSNIGSGIGSAISSGVDWLSNLFSDEDLKCGRRQLTDDEVDKLMGHLTAYKYRYKGDPTNPERAGVMAQDLEKGGSTSVVNTPAGKMIQGPNMMSEALAVLANQHERIKKLEGKQ